MHLLVNEEEIKKIKEVEELTLSDYEIVGKFIKASNIMQALEDLLLEYHKLQEKLEDIEANIDENYQVKDRDLYDEYGVSVNDF